MNTSNLADGAQTKDVSYRSPKRCLILAFRKSRDRWKKKAQLRNVALKVLKVRVGDLEQSRLQHREQAHQARLELAQARQQLEEVQAELEHRRQADEARQTREKKMRPRSL